MLSRTLVTNLAVASWKYDFSRYQRAIECPWFFDWMSSMPQYTLLSADIQANQAYLLATCPLVLRYLCYSLIPTSKLVLLSVLSDIHPASECGPVMVGVTHRAWGGPRAAPAPGSWWPPLDGGTRTSLANLGLVSSGRRSFLPGALSSTPPIPHPIGLQWLEWADMALKKTPYDDPYLRPADIQL